MCTFLRTRRGWVMRALLRFISVALAAAAFAVPAASAGLLDPITQLGLPTCGSNSYPFAQFNDAHAYFEFANNGFEGGTNGWTGGGRAYAVFGNEPWYVNGWGSRALPLPQGASATSPAFCLNLLDPAVRMFTRTPNRGHLTIQVVLRGVSGNVTGSLNFGGNP